MNTQSDQTYQNFLDATNALVENLACSEPIVAFQNAREQLDTNDQAQKLLQRLGQLQSEIRASQDRGAAIQADIEQLRAVQLEAQTNPTINNFALTQQAAVTYLREINQSISQLLGFDFAALTKPAGGCC